MRITSRCKGPLHPNITICLTGMPTDSILISIISQCNSQLLNLRGLPVPHSHQCLMDIKFVDDTTVSMQGGVKNLKKLKSGLSLFCKRSNAMINRHKSFSTWVSNESHPAWHPHLVGLKVPLCPYCISSVNTQLT